jgi:hypothetical protein
MRRLTVAALALELVYLGCGNSGRIEARFRDGLPGYAMLAHHIPPWLPEVLPLNGLNATLEVQRRCRLTDIRILRADGGPLTARGRIQATPTDIDGAVVVRLQLPKFVSVGLMFDGDDVHVSPLAGDTWLRQMLAPLPPASCAALSRELGPISTARGDFPGSWAGWNGAVSRLGWALTLPTRTE